jgi:hypothetical protein
MRTLNMIFVIVCGIVCGWWGYWLGHWAGWSENADWPSHIGGGAGAIVLSVVFMLIGVAAATVIMSFPTYRTTRRLLREGTPARATVLEAHKAGLTIRSTSQVWDRIDCRLEVHPEKGPSFQARAHQFMTAAEESFLLPDAVVDVRYDPEKRARVAIEGPARR